MASVILGVLAAKGIGMIIGGVIAAGIFGYQAATDKSFRRAVKQIIRGK